MKIEIKRAYEPPSSGDGRRVLVDRIWPRGVSKDDLRIDDWSRDLAPSNELRRWFGHDPARWAEFRRRFQDELEVPEQQARLDQLVSGPKDGKLTLVYGARDPEHNQAVVLRDLLAKRSLRS